MYKKIINNHINNEFKKILLLIYKTYFDKPIINFYKTNYKKNVLISYIKYPFIKGVNYSHTNNIEAISIGEVFNKLGYNVDIVNYDYEGKINYEKYNIIFGFGEPLEKSFYFNINNLKRIYYGTGMHLFIQNYNTIKRIGGLYNKKGILIVESSRLVFKSWNIQTQLSNAIITLGNNTIIDSYKQFYDKSIYSIPVTYYNIENINYDISNNIEEKKLNFIWFGSSGLIHKGLDLLLEIFKEKGDLNLHICGPIDNEKIFKDYFYSELYETKNIFNYGFVDIHSYKFKSIVNKCAFSIFPSCAEGEPSSIINLMSLGIIPIVTKESGINLDLAINIDSLNKYEIINSINKVNKLNNLEIINFSKKIKEETLKNNSIKKFKLKLKENLIKII
ncbi:MAG: glycosyltransferase [Candidatus Gracilibacteria bacterium]|nr:glycosyltransferase [Candidatus Gracilibacteria bacterium]